MEKKNWKGVDCARTDRPGTSLLLNKKRQFKPLAKL